MTRLLNPILIAAGLLACSFLAADIEKVGPVGPGGKPDREGADEKEGKARPEMGKPGADPGEDHEAIHQKLAAEGEVTLKEIARLMDKVRDNLSRKDTGDKTQGDQREVVRKIQELIDKLEKG